jgi:hypothetical protein
MRSVRLLGISRISGFVHCLPPPVTLHAPCPARLYLPRPCGSACASSRPPPSNRTCRDEVLLTVSAVASVSPFMHNERPSAAAENGGAWSSRPSPRGRLSRPRSPRVPPNSFTRRSPSTRPLVRAPWRPDRLPHLRSPRPLGRTGRDPRRAIAQRPLPRRPPRPQGPAASSPRRPRGPGRQPRRRPEPGRGRGPRTPRQDAAGRRRSHLGLQHGPRLHPRPETDTVHITAEWGHYEKAMPPTTKAGNAAAGGAPPSRAPKRSGSAKTARPSG